MEHHVYFWLNDDRKNAADRAAFEAGLAALFQLPGVAGGRWSVPAKVEIRPVVDQSWDYALSMTFATLADHDAYQADPDHHQFIEAFKPWWAKVLVMDLA
jgi:hypothetical protein